jgi:hypothetical protein
MTDWQIVAWWELRRIPFNLVVGVAGIASCLIVGAVAIITEALLGSVGWMPDSPLFALVWVLIYGMMANVFYTGGWVAELIVKRACPEDAASFPTLSFSLGLALSALLTLSVGVVIGVAGGLWLVVCLVRGTGG